MAQGNTPSKIDAAAEQAYAEAAAKKSTAEAVGEAVMADAPKEPVKAEAVKKAVAAPAEKAPATKAAAAKTGAAKTTPAKKVAAKKAPAKKTPVKAAAKKAAAKKAPAKIAAKTAGKTTEKPTTNPLIKLKDTIMATAQKTDITTQAKDFAADMQERLKTVYSKTGEFAGDFTEFNKANAEAAVESGKIFFAGAQELVKDNVETGKTVIETVTEDAKKIAAVKSPTELMQLQGELARRNFDAVVAYGSQRTEAWVKLYNDAFAPISNRVSVAAEKITKAA